MFLLTFCTSVNRRRYSAISRFVYRHFYPAKQLYIRLWTLLSRKAAVFKDILYIRLSTPLSCGAPVFKDILYIRTWKP